MQTMSQPQAQSGVARMLQKGILTDITVNAVGGSIRAHRAVLAARSPVFLSMFSHALREKELSTVDISDMSIAACRAFVRYIYGASVSEEELLAHRSELVAAGDKYCIANLKETCEKSLGKDVGTENVLQIRLQMAHTYSLAALKRSCVRLLVDFGKMYEIPEDFLEFTENSDPELVDEIKRFAFSRGRKFPAILRESAAAKASAKKARLPSVRKSTPRQASGSPAKQAEKATPSQVSASIPAKRPRRSSVRKSTSGQDSDAFPDKRARRANVRLTGDEWALPGSRGTR
ncbi:BTB/POZ domain-containing protein At1g55760-like [Lolium rigidum]|uniref:BTB/POZ domain-containing protein At1g55760-like n=1 Tax=Lolium rigidum TaxID=89674 RepID=UPI001F5C477E|nr:BTB/POZ domain-containing protein At1g55760-like [Lolium rigidum]